MVTLVVIFIYDIILICKKFKGHIKPVHIFLINFIITITAKSIYLVGLFVHQVIMFMHPFETCYHYPVGLIIHISVNLDVTTMQIDRFVAIKSSLEYPGFATNSRAVCICIFSKLFSFVISVIISLVDKDYMKCNKVISLLLTRTSNIVTISFSQLLMTFVVGLTSGYLGYTLVKKQNSVGPAANVESERKERSRYKIKRIDEQPNMFYPVESGEATNVDEMPSHSNSGNNVVENSHTETNSKSIFVMAKTALNLNYIVILNCLIDTPIFIMSIVFWNCTFDDGKCDAFVRFNQYMILPRLIVVFAGCCIFSYKIKHSDIM